MPVSRQSRYKDRYARLEADSVAIVQARDFSIAELAQTAEDSFARIPGAVLVPIERIDPNPDNPRRRLNDAALADLTVSIAERGLLQPLVVRRNPDRAGEYVVIAGSRRLLAARRAHSDPDEAVRTRVATLPCIIKEESDHDAFADALLENLARSDLSRAEMMEALLRLHNDYGWSSHYIAKRTGRNQSDISQLLGVARNPDLAQLVRQEVIKPTVAGEINRLPDLVRDATIAEVRAGTVRTVADVRLRRRPAPPPTATSLAVSQTESQSAQPAITPSYELSSENRPDGPSDTAYKANRVISLTPVSASDLDTPLTALSGSDISDRVISLGSANPVADMV